MKTRFSGEPVFVCQIQNGILHTPANHVKPFVYKDLTMTLQALESRRFVRKTQLAPGEYRKNFHQIDRDILAVVTSAEADQITPLMSKIYLRLVNAPDKYWERDGVLRIAAELRDEKLIKAWAVLCELVGVASATASKAMRWLHEQGIIGYFAGKNGVGLRIFLNRAVSSIGMRPAQGNKKILAFAPASSDGAPTSANEPAFKDSFAVLESSDIDINPRAPKSGADNARVDKTSSEPSQHTSHSSHLNPNPNAAPSQAPGVISLDEVITRLRTELEPTLHAAVRQAAAREHERTREWLENRGLPKAARVAQHEAYNVLRRYGVIGESTHNSRSHAGIDCGELPAQTSHPLTHEEITELAESCIALLEVHGQAIERTLSEMSSEAGGFLLPRDAIKVREKANALLSPAGNRRIEVR
jgi:hypothetical protein